MVRTQIFSASLLIIIMLVNETYGQSDVNGIWSGTVKMKQEYTGELGKSVLEITVTIRANIASGIMKYEGQWKAAQGVHIVECSGSGNAELHELSMSEEDNTYYSYYIAVIGPDYTCVNDEESGQNKRDITISDKVLATNLNILSGTKTETHETGTGPGTTTLSWHLTRSTVGDVELIVTPDKYDTWLPEPGMNELTVGSVMNISLKLQARGGGSTTKKAKAFELKLFNTSREPGVTINFPTVQFADPMPDLRFMIQPNAGIGEEFQLMKINCPGGCQTGSAKVGSYDGGGWTVLTAVAILEDNTRIKGMLFVTGGEMDIRIPKRDPNSKIGTAWLSPNGNPNEMDDKETSSGNTNNGDGLTAYEEYRGVISEGKFKRLKPDKKELGIKTKRIELSLFTEAFQLFERETQIKIILFNENEIGRNRRLNKNALSAHDYDQFVLRVEKRNLPTGIIGTAYNGPDIPKVVDPVVFDWDQIQVLYQQKVINARPQTLRFTLREMLAWAVAHEMGHAVNVWHHGDDLQEPNKAVSDLTDRLRIFDRNGNLIINRPWYLEYVGKSRGTVESGDLTCVLSYNPYYLWGYTVGADGAGIYNQVPLMPVGKTFCSSNAGTSINATSLFFGDAASNRGNCLKQIKLR